MVGGASTCGRVVPEDRVQSRPPMDEPPGSSAKVLTLPAPWTSSGGAVACVLLCGGR